MKIIFDNEEQMKGWIDFLGREACPTESGVPIRARGTACRALRKTCKAHWQETMETVVEGSP